MHIEEKEIVVLLVAVFSLVFFFSILRAQREARFPRILTWGFILLIAANFFTVIEGVLLGDVFNFLEHLSIAASGLLFALGARALLRGGPPGQDGK